MANLKRKIVYRLKRLPFKIGWDDYLAFGITLIGVLGFIDSFVQLIPGLTEPYQQIRAELIGIGITVFIIGNANEAVKTREEKERLILQLGSINNGFATEAARQLGVRGWLTDGTLTGVDLLNADLSGAFLFNADLNCAILMNTHLKGAWLLNANLSGAMLIGSDMSGADLSGANLFLACLIAADLSGTNLSKAIVKDEQLAKTKSLLNAIMTDGTKYDGRFNLPGDINEAKSRGIDIDNASAMADFYNVALEKYQHSQEWAREHLDKLRGYIFE